MWKAKCIAFRAFNQKISRMTGKNIYRSIIVYDRSAELGLILKLYGEMPESDPIITASIREWVLSFWRNN